MTHNSSSKRFTNDFGLYEITLFVCTQLGYIPIVSSMLATNFFEPEQGLCSNETFFDEYQHRQFHFVSLLVDWNIGCSKNLVVWIFSLTDIISTSLMCGALLGAFLSGFLADRYGRKPIVVGNLAVVGICNALICILAMKSIILTGVLFLIIGVATGGYMVVNLVLMIEAVQHSRSRLLIVSLNGWPIGMCFTSLIAYLTKNWFFYHATTACIAAFFVISLQTLSFESVRWLTLNSYTSRAGRTATRIQNLNSKFCVQQEHQMSPSALQLTAVTETDPKKEEITHVNVKNRVKSHKYSYIDLFKHKSVGLSIIALTYCATASSFVSFSGYFYISRLPGDRCLNLFLMGLLKLLLGMIPFICGSFVGRRPILLTSVAVAAFTSVILACILTDHQLRQTIYVSILCVLMTSALDPNWKVVHLYSTELFPTGIRNMARGISQVGARIGSTMAPIMRIVFGVYPVFSMVLCVCLLSVQWLIAFLVFPETSHKQLPDELPAAGQSPSLVESSSSSKI